MVRRRQRERNQAQTRPEAQTASANQTAAAKKSARAENPLWSVLKVLSPLLTLGLMLGVYALFNVAYGDCNARARVGCKPLDVRPLMREIIPADKRELAEGVREVSDKGVMQESQAGRSLWAFVVALNFLACLASAALAYYVMSAALKKWERTRVRAPSVLAAAIFVSALVAWLMTPGASPPGDGGAPDLRPQLFQALEFTAKLDVPTVIVMVRAAVAAGYAVAALYALTACVILLPPPSGAEPDSALELARKMRLLRNLLYCGTVVLVLISLRFAVEMRWVEELVRAWQPEPSKQVEAGIKTAERLFSVLTSMAAGVNTLMLAAVYLPAALVLRQRAHLLAEAAFGEGGTLPEREAWMQRRGLLLSTTDYVPRVAAILAPLLAGPIGDIMGKLAR